MSIVQRQLCTLYSSCSFLNPWIPNQTFYPKRRISSLYNTKRAITGIIFLSGDSISRVLGPCSVYWTRVRRSTFEFRLSVRDSAERIQRLTKCRAIQWIFKISFRNLWKSRTFSVAEFRKTPVFANRSSMRNHIPQ